MARPPASFFLRRNLERSGKLLEHSWDCATQLERTLAALEKLDFTFSYDLFRHAYHVGDDALTQRIGENVEHAILVLRTSIISRFKFDPGPEKIKAAVYRLCLGHAFNPVRDYLDGLEWDGEPRLDTWLSKYLVAQHHRRRPRPVAVDHREVRMAQARRGNLY